MQAFKFSVLVLVALAVFMDASPTKRKQVVKKEAIEAKLFEKIATTWLKHGQPIQTANNPHSISHHHKKFPHKGIKKSKRHSPLDHFRYQHHHSHHSHPTYHYEPPKIYTPPARPFVITPAPPSQDEHTSRRGEYLLEMAYDRFFGEEYQPKDRKVEIVRKDEASRKRKDRQRHVLIQLHRIPFQTRLQNSTHYQLQHTNLPPRKIIAQQVFISHAHAPTPSPSIADKQPAFSVLKGALPGLFLTTERSKVVADYAVREITEKTNVDEHARELPEEHQEATSKTISSLQPIPETTLIHFPVTTDHAETETAAPVILLKEYSTEAYAKTIDEIHQIVLAGVGTTDTKDNHHEEKEDLSAHEDQIVGRIYESRTDASHAENDKNDTFLQEVLQIESTSYSPQSEEELKRGEVDGFTIPPAAVRSEDIVQETSEELPKIDTPYTEKSIQYSTRSPLSDKAATEAELASEPPFESVSGLGRDALEDPMSSHSKGVNPNLVTEQPLDGIIGAASQQGRDALVNPVSPPSEELISEFVTVQSLYEITESASDQGHDALEYPVSSPSKELISELTEQPLYGITGSASGLGRDALDDPVSSPSKEVISELVTQQPLYGITESASDQKLDALEDPESSSSTEVLSDLTTQQPHPEIIESVADLGDETPENPLYLTVAHLTTQVISELKTEKSLPEDNQLAPDIGRDSLEDSAQPPSADFTTIEAVSELTTEQIFRQSEILARDIFDFEDTNTQVSTLSGRTTEINVTPTSSEVPQTQTIERDNMASERNQELASTPQSEFSTTDSEVSTSTQFLSEGDFGRDSLFDTPVSDSIDSKTEQPTEQDLTDATTTNPNNKHPTGGRADGISEEEEANPIEAVLDLRDVPEATETAEFSEADPAHTATTTASYQFFRGLFADDLPQSENETDSTEISVLGLPLSFSTETSEIIDAANKLTTLTPLLLSHEVSTADQHLVTEKSAENLPKQLETDSPFTSPTIKFQDFTTEILVIETTDLPIRTEPDLGRHLADDTIGADQDQPLENTTKNNGPNEGYQSTEVNSETTIPDNMQVDDSFMVKEAKNKDQSTFQEDKNVDPMVLESYVPVLKRIVPSQLPENQNLDQEDDSESDISNIVQAAEPQPLPLGATEAVESETGDIIENSPDYTENPRSVDQEHTTLINDDRGARLIPPWLLQNQNNTYQNLESTTERHQTKKQPTEKPLEDETGMELMVVDSSIEENKSKVDALMPLIPVIVEDLKRGLVSKEEREILEEVFGPRWKDIMAMARKRSQLDLAMEQESETSHIRTHRGNRTETSRRQGRDVDYVERLNDYLHEDDYYEEDGQDDEAPDIGELKEVADAHINWRHQTLPRGT